MTDIKLSPHFSLSEFTRSQTASRLGIRNEPDLHQFRNLIYLAINLEEVRAACGDRSISISSGLRVPALNERIAGSSATSKHQYGLAADFTVAGQSVEETLRRIIGSKINFQKVIIEHRSWIHFETYELDAGEQGEVLIASGTRDNPIYRSHT